MRHRARELMVGQRTAALNALRGHLSEIGVVAAQGVPNAYALKRLACDGVDDDVEIVVPDCVRLVLLPLVRQIEALDEAIETIKIGLMTVGLRESDLSVAPEYFAQRIAEAKAPDMPLPGGAECLRPRPVGSIGGSYRLFPDCAAATLLMRPR